MLYVNLCLPYYVIVLYYVIVIAVLCYFLVTLFFQWFWKRTWEIIGTAFYRPHAIPG